MQSLAEEMEAPVDQAEIDAAENELNQETPAEKAPETKQEAPEAAQNAEDGEIVKEGEKKPEKPPKGFVPQQALHEERQRRKEMQAQIEAMRQQYETRFQQIQQYVAQQNAPKPPEFETDPVGNMKFTQDQLQAQLQEIRQQQQQEYERQVRDYQQQQYISRVAQEVTQAETEFQQENPEYLDAVKHLKSIRAAQLQALGMPTNAILDYVQREAFQVAEAALQNGHNPAEVAFKMAVASGWRKPEAKQEAQPNKEKIETLQKGVQAAKSLGSGGNPPQKMTFDALADLPDDEFEDFMKSGKWKKMGD